MEISLVGVVVVQLLIIAVLSFFIKKLMQRPDFKVYKAQEKELEKVRKAKDSIEKSFENFRASNGRDILILSVKESIDADALMILCARIMDNQHGLAGDAQNVEGLLTALYGGDEKTQHLNHLFYENHTKIAVWEGSPKMPHTLSKLIAKD